MEKKDLVDITKDYYDSESADSFYFHVWGGEDIHVGIYQNPRQPIREASRTTVMEMARQLPRLDERTEVLDIGAGYGGSARFLTTEYGCPVDCLNLSETENRRNREMNIARRLDDRIKVLEGNFEDLPFQEDAYDVVWSQDALLHSNRKRKVFEEVARVLRPGGHFIFTDPMQADDCPDGVLQPVLDRIHLEEMGSVARYRQLAADLGFREAQVLEMPFHLVNHYSRVLEEVENNFDTVVEKSGREYTERMMQGLVHWIEAGKKGFLNWGILHFVR